MRCEVWKHSLTVSPKQSWQCQEQAELLWIWRSCMASISGQLELLGVPHQQFDFGSHLALTWHTCCFALEAPSWLIMLQGDSGHRIQAGSFLVGRSSNTYAKRPPILTHPCASCRDCSVCLRQQVTDCWSYSELLEELQRNKKCLRDTVSTTGCRAELGWGRAGQALHTHMRGVGSECSHTNPAVGWLLLQPTGGVKMFHGEMYIYI